MGGGRHAEEDEEGSLPAQWHGDAAPGGQQASLRKECALEYQRQRKSLACAGADCNCESANTVEGIALCGAHAKEKRKRQTSGGQGFSTDSGAADAPSNGGGAAGLPPRKKRGAREELKKA